MADIAAPSAAPALPLTSRQRNAAGALCLLLIIVSWLTQAELMHRLHLTEQSYAPAQMIFVIHAVWALGLPLALLVRWLALRPTLPPIPWRAAALYGLVVSQIGFFGGWCWLYSVGLTPVGMNTAVYNAAFVFVFALSVAFLRETVTVGKVGGSLLCFGGLVCLGVASLTTTGLSDGTALGYLALFFSMMCWAAYSVVTVKLMGNEPAYARTPVMGLLSIGAIGCGTMALCWVVLLLNHVTGLEPLVWPTGNTAKVVAIACVCDFVLNCALMVGTLITSALFMSLGMLLVLPCGFLVQLVLGEGVSTAPLDIVAVVLIAVGCLAFNAWDVAAQWWRRRQQHLPCFKGQAPADVEAVLQTVERSAPGHDVLMVSDGAAADDDDDNDDEDSGVVGDL